MIRSFTPARAAGALLGLVLLLPAALPAQDAELPAPDALVARHVAAIGGEAAVRALRSMRMTGTFELPSMGLKGDLRLESAAPNRTAVTVSLPGVGDVRSGYDGTAAWEVNPMSGARLLEGPELARMIDEADFHGGMLRRQAGIASRRTVERTELGGRACWLVQVTWTSGRETHECYAVDDGLLVATQSTQTSPMGTQKVVSLIAEYRTIGALKYASRVRQQMMGTEQLFTIVAVEPNAADDATFAPPPAIRALLDARAVGAKPAGTVPPR